MAIWECVFHPRVPPATPNQYTSLAQQHHQRHPPPHKRPGRRIAATRHRLCQGAERHRSHRRAAVLAGVFHKIRHLCAGGRWRSKHAYHPPHPDDPVLERSGKNNTDEHDDQNDSAVRRQPVHRRWDAVPLQGPGERDQCHPRMEELSLAGGYLSVFWFSNIIFYSLYLSPTDRWTHVLGIQRDGVPDPHPVPNR